MPLRRHSRISSYQSKSFTEKRRERVLIGIGLFVICAGLWIFAFSRFFSLQYFSIDNIEVYGADQDIVPAVQSASWASIQGSYYGSFSKSDALIYPRASVAAAAVGASPRIASAEVSRDGWHNLIVSVVEKAPAAIVCADLPNFDQKGALSSDGGDCYATDASGLIFKKISPEAVIASSEGSITLYYVPALPDDGTAVGSYATSTQEFSALQSFVQGARSAGIRSEAVLMKDGGEYELYADDPADPSNGAAPAPVVVIYVNDKAGLQTELSDLAAFWSRMVSSASGKLPRFESIDLRYGSNVFYRLAK